MTIQRLAFITIIATYILIVFGGFVASTESGMGCGPEWPLCNGAVIPELQGETLIEFTHRILGLIIAILAVTLFIKAFRMGKGSIERIAAYWMISILSLQITLGAIVVILDIPTSVITIHLIIAMAFIASLIWIWRTSNRNLAANYKENLTILDDHKQKSIKRHLNISLTLVTATFIFGAYTKHQHPYGSTDDHHSHSHDSTAFEWLNGNSWLPLPEGLIQTLESLHLLLALTTAAYILFLSYRAFFKGWGSPLQKRLILAASMVFLQATIGVLTVLTHIPLVWALLHLATGTALFAIVIESRIILSLFTIRTNKMESENGNFADYS